MRRRLEWSEPYNGNPELTPDGLLLQVFTRTGSDDTAVLQGPADGEDAAAIDPDGGTLVVSSDPVSLAASHVGRLGVHVACNDVADVEGAVVGTAQGGEPAVALDGRGSTNWSLMTSTRCGNRDNGATEEHSEPRTVEREGAFYT